MLQTISATQAKNNFGELLKSVYLEGKHTQINKGDIPVAILMPVEEYHAFLRQPVVAEKKMTKKEKARQELLTLLNEVHNRMPDISETEADKLINEAIATVRANP